MMGPNEMQHRKGHCPLMVTVEMKVGEPGDEEEDEQESDEEGVHLPPLVGCTEERMRGGSSRGSRCASKSGGGAMCIKP